MPRHKLAMAFVMDPIGGIDIAADTTFVLMLEAHQRGHRVAYIAPADLGAEEGNATAQVQSVVRLSREAGRHVELEPPHSSVLDDDFDVIFQRTDPPVDAAYVEATQILSLCRRALVLNRPQGILAANEKLYALHFPELMAETIVTHRIPQLVDFFHVRHDDRNLFSILEQATRFGKRRTMAQRYLPEVRRGDKRILLLDGEPLGALLRVPAEGEVRANLHVGGRAERTRLDEADLRIVERLAPSLRRDGLFFVGIDVIGGRLTEVNVTSPTGVQEVNALEGDQLEVRILAAVEALVGRKHS